MPEIAEDRLTRVSLLIRSSFPEFETCSLEDIKEFVKIRFNEIIDTH